MYPRIKRLLDFVSALILLFLLAPIQLLIASFIWLTMGRPILFQQIRPGFCERPFRCVKFRTMNEARDEQGCLLDDAHRLTWLGKLLRRTSLDELPQLWNVLRGELSLVGPRPLMERYLPYYTEVERRRHAVRPGLTGWAQINGRNRLSFDKRLEMDVWYVEHLSFWLDLRILMASVWIVLSQRGVAEDTIALDESRRSTSEPTREVSRTNKLRHPGAPSDDRGGFYEEPTESL